MNTLDQVAESFRQWRSTRKKRGHTPTRLIDQAISLVGHYRKSHIIEHLGINNKALVRWISNSKSTEAPDVIELTPSSSISSPASIVTVSTELGNGAVLKLMGEPDQVMKLVLALHKGAIL